MLVQAVRAVYDWWKASEPTKEEIDALFTPAQLNRATRRGNLVHAKGKRVKLTNTCYSRN